MRKILMTPLIGVMALGFALSVPAIVARAQQPNVNDIVEIEMLTHTELTAKQKAGFTSVLIVTGGTEERGPQNILAGHTIMARRHGIEIARRLGKTMMAPVLPMAVAATGLRGIKRLVGALDHALDRGAGRERGDPDADGKF